MDNGQAFLKSWQRPCSKRNPLFSRVSKNYYQLVLHGKPIPKDILVHIISNLGFYLLPQSNMLQANWGPTQLFSTTHSRVLTIASCQCWRDLVDQGLALYIPNLISSQWYLFVLARNLKLGAPNWQLLSH